MGLIQVMSLLQEPGKIGAAMIVALVSTLYGFVLSNFLFLPWAARIRRQAEQRDSLLRMMEIAILGILDGSSPAFIRDRLALHVRLEFPGSEG